MTRRLAIIAGYGTLPQQIANAVPGALYVTFAGVDIEVPPGLEHLPSSFEKLGALFKGLRKAGCQDVVFAGAITRPSLNPKKFDLKTMAIVPKFMAAMGKGDDALLRTIAGVFEKEGFVLRAAHDVVPALTLTAAQSCGCKPGPDEVADFTRASAILAALGPQDVAQSAVVAGGLCLGIETIQGTDAMLGFVGETPSHLRRAKGVLVKAAKVGQDPRFDLPTIGPATVEAAARAGLAGIFIPAGNVIVLDQEDVFRLVKAHDMFLVAQ